MIIKYNYTFFVDGKMFNITQSKKNWILHDEKIKIKLDTKHNVEDSIYNIH